MEEFIQKIKCKLGFHLIRVRQVPLRDKYAEPEFYCICCKKVIE